MKSLNAIVFPLCLVVSSLCFAGGSSGIGEIEFLYQRSSDGLLTVKKAEGSWANPDSCDNSERFILTKANLSRDEFYSALLAAKYSGGSISAWLHGCIEWNGATYPAITDLTVH